MNNNTQDQSSEVIGRWLMFSQLQHSLILSFLIIPLFNSIPGPGSPSATLQYLSFTPQQQQQPYMEPPVAPPMMSSRSIDDLITAGEDDFSPFTDESVRQQPSEQEMAVSMRPIRSSAPPSVTARSVRYAEFHDLDSPTLSNLASTSSGAGTGTGTGTGTGSGLSNTHPPSFNDSVKRSTRFITAVPASEVLDKVETILEQVRLEHVQTPIGIIGKIAINWAAYRIDVWGADTVGPPLCALQLYQMPAASSSILRSDSLTPKKNYSPMSHSRFGNRSNELVIPCVSLQSPFLVSGGGRISPLHVPPYVSPYGEHSSLSSSSHTDGRRFSPSLVGSDGLNTNNQQQLFLAEFVRGQVEIFAFKRFYQWVRQRLSQLVKRDYAFKLLDQGGSPM